MSSRKFLGSPIRSGYHCGSPLTVGSLVSDPFVNFSSDSILQLRWFCSSVQLFQRNNSDRCQLSSWPCWPERTKRAGPTATVIVPPLRLDLFLCWMNGPVSFHVQGGSDGTIVVESTCGRNRDVWRRRSPLAERPTQNVGPLRPAGPRESPSATIGIRSTTARLTVGRRSLLREDTDFLNELPVLTV